MSKKTYYLLKIKGKAKIPDYVQVRDDNFTLIGYYRPERDGKALKTLEDPEKALQLEELIVNLAYGKIEKVEI